MRRAPLIPRPRSSLRTLAAACVAALLAAAPRAAEACAVCGAGRDEENRAAFLLTTAFLSLLPLVMVGGFVWWLRRRARELEAGGEAEPAPRAEALRTASRS